jgi:hypothetical protein
MHPSIQRFSAAPRLASSLLLPQNPSCRRAPITRSNRHKRNLPRSMSTRPLSARMLQPSARKCVVASASRVLHATLASPQKPLASSRQLLYSHRPARAFSPIVALGRQGLTIQTASSLTSTWRTLMSLNPRREARPCPLLPREYPLSRILRQRKKIKRTRMAISPRMTPGRREYAVAAMMATMSHNFLCLPLHQCPRSSLTLFQTRSSMNVTSRLLPTLSSRNHRLKTSSRKWLEIISTRSKLKPL